MAKSVVVTTTNYQHLRKVNVLTAAVAGTSQPEWTSVTDDGKNTFETVVKVTPAVAGLKTVIVPNDTPPGYRYWRFNVTSTNTNNSMNFAEAELRESAGGADQTGSGTASSPQGNLTATPPAAFDNNASTTWHSAIGTMPHQLVYDFGVGVTKAITQVMIQAHPSNAAYTPLTFDMQYSSDNSSWTTSWSVTTPNTWAGGEIRVFTKP
jgi:opacity protein-like surface antigen